MQVLINYANSTYDSVRKWNSFTGKHIAHFEKIYNFGPNDIDSTFRDSYSHILNIQRGNGLWLWKPYFINRVIEQLQDGDILFYCDSGAFFIRSPKSIMALINKDNPLFVCDIPLIESCLTKPKCFEKMGLNEANYKNSNQIIATYFCFMITPFTRKFMKEWLSLCCDYELISPEGFKKNDTICHNYGEKFVTHREDQSIFSLLCKKYKILPHKDFSQRGLRPRSYYSPFYAYQEPNHPFDKYKPIIFLHKAPKLTIKWLIRYLYHTLKK